RTVRRISLVVALVVALAASGCAFGADTARLHQQAQAALARWADAVAVAGGQALFVPVGELTAQVGDWEPDFGDIGKVSLMSGVVQSAIDLPANQPPPTGVIWPDGTSVPVERISAKEALAEINADSVQPCPECVPLTITAARLTTGPVLTSRGPAKAPVWDFTLQGTAVHITRVAVARAVRVVPPTWDPYNAPGGIAIDSATGSGDGSRLTVAFTGAPDTGDKPCGADYTAEAVESSLAVVVIVIEHRNLFPAACSAVGARRTTDVQLAVPLGDRTVLEVQQGLPVPALLTP
ncbi:MAG: hypothetical protein ACHQ15_09010, partial [Candidatus Limnocylindrales bacterium]